MNAKHLVAVLTVLATTGTAFAQGIAADNANVVSPRTRTEVKAEIAQARADGTLEINDGTYPALPKQFSSKTRAEVRAELEEYRKAYPNGEAIYWGS